MPEQVNRIEEEINELRQRMEKIEALLRPGGMKEKESRE